MSKNFLVSLEEHNNVIAKAYEVRGYASDEAKIAAEVCGWASWHGIHSHNGLKALDLETKFGAKAGGCKPKAEISVIDSKFEAVEKWNANLKLGQVVAKQAIDRCIELANRFGTGTVVVDNAFHYLWGGGYVIDAALRGYIAYTNCTSTLSEVVPFGGKRPSLGTNPHSWAFPTQDLLGFPICIDWATSTMATGKVQTYLREGKELPANTGVDKNGNVTRNPAEIYALLPFGEHKGYGMSLIDEIYAGYIGGSYPTIRGHFKENFGKKCTCCFYFQVTHPESLDCGNFADGVSQAENVVKVLKDILADGNENCMLPGQIEHQNALLSKKHQGLIFTEAEFQKLNEIANALSLNISQKEIIL